MSRIRIFAGSFIAVMLVLVGCSKSIDIEEARNFVLKDAGINVKDATFTSEKSDEEGFEFTFQTKDRQYDYELDKSGKIEETSNYKLEISNNDVTQPNSFQETESSKTLNNEILTKEQAFEKVVKHFNINKNQIENLKINQEMDDGQEVYDIEFDYNGKEYSAEVNIKTGALTSTDIDDIRS